MSQSTAWRVTTDAMSCLTDEHTLPEREEHEITYRFSRLKGRITVSIDGDSFDLPAGPLGMKAARREIFRLGDEQAVLAVDRMGHAQLIVGGRTVAPLK